MDVHEAVWNKRAVRQFADRPLPPETLESILNAGRRAQSSKNTQPWHFLVLQDPERRNLLAQFGTYTDPIRRAAAVIAILTPDPEGRFSIMFDAGQAAGYMQLAAWELGVGSVPVTIHKYDDARSAFELPEDLHFRIVLALGYPSDPEALTNAPRVGGRRPFDELVSYEHIEAQ